jgi:patatin-like phospholipase/acyl hydrolase
VIAYQAGGVLTTQIPVTDDPSKATALFFGNQTVDDLIEAVRQYEQVEHYFNPSFIRAHAEKFDESIFIDTIRQFIADKYAKHEKIVSDALK